MSLKILLGKFVAFFAGQIPVEGHKNIIDSFQKLIVSSKRFICAHGGPTVLGQIGRRILGRRALRAGIHHSLKSPWCSCVWITLPASSYTGITAQSNGSTYGKVARRGVRKTAAQRNRNTATAPVHSQKPKCQNTECRSALWIGVAQEGSSRVRSNKDSLKKIPTNGNSVTNDQIQNNCPANRLRPRPFHAHQQLHNIPIARKPAAERPRSSWSRRTPKTS